jgi:hypothetical protein
MLAAMALLMLELQRGEHFLQPVNDPEELLV